ncbi:putative disease resistance RPP13-like protein 3 [Hordeum vulgare]|nr:putative disease resistance RPP13-like protein 3 [Hordeum vulgare]
MQHNPVKLLHEYHQLLLILAIVTSVSLQAVLLSEGMVGFETALADFSKLLSVMGLMNSLVWMCSRKSIFAGLETYFSATAVVLEDYVLLTTLNKRYLEMVTIPLMIFAFIAALWYTLPVPKLGTQNEYRSVEKEKQSKYQSEKDLLKKDTKSEYQSEEVPLEENTEAEYQGGDISLEKAKQRDDQSEEVSLEEDTTSGYQSEDILLKKDTQGENQSEEVTKSDYQSEEVLLEDNTQAEYQNEEVISEEDTQSKYQNEEVLPGKDTQSEYQNEEVPSENYYWSENQNRSGDDAMEKYTQWELTKLAMVPYFIQLSLGVWIQYKGQLEDGIFIISNFLLFFCSALCALTVMLASPPIGLNPGVVVQVLPVMHKTSIIMLMMTAHAMAAEWLREDFVFVCMPELAAVLARFTIYLRHPEHGVGIKVATSRRSCVIILGSVGAILICLAFFCAEDRITLTSLLRRVLCIASSSSALCYLHLWLLRQWPASTTDSNELDQLLKFSSENSFYVAAGMLCFDQQILQESMAAAHFLFTSRLTQYLLSIFEEEMQHLLLIFEEKMQHPLRDKFLLMLTILVPLLVQHLRGKGVKWHQRPQIKNHRSPRLTLEIKALLCMVDVVYKWLNKLMPQVIIVFVDLSYIRAEVNDRLYCIAEHVNANYTDTTTVHDQDIKEWFVHVFDKVSDEVTEYILAPAVNPQLTGLYADSCSLDKQMKYLEKMLDGAGSEGREVVCVFAMDDVEKTELALEVCERIKGRFSCHVSVSAGWKPDMAKLIMNMIKQVGSKHIGTGDVGDVYPLTQSLKQLLQNKRYLVMVDDLCSNDDWGTIKSCFPENNQCSRIIITTRFEDVAKGSDHFYWIPVPVEASLESTLSGFFPSKRHTKDPCESLGLQWTELEQMKQFIKVRYNGLSANLRACLLYLSIFPEKHEIDLERLVRLWLANGFIRAQDDLYTEETAGCYIDELIARKLIKPSQWRHDGTLRSCIVHPLIHEFIVCQAMENKFVSLVHAEQQGVSLPSSNPTAPWISLQNSMELDLRTDLSYVRSVTVFGQASDLPPQTNLISEGLRVLDLGDCEGPVRLDGLWELLHLRYLSLGGTNISELPAKIGELIYLQTLDMRSTKVKELPPNIVRLENLMHLLAGNAKLPHEISKMKELVTLSCANIGSWGSSASVMKELGEIANLRDLELFCEVTENLGDKEHMPDNEKQVVFMQDGFQTLNKLHIQGSFQSLSFEVGALPNVQVLELNFEKGHPEESASMSGIEHLLSLEHVLLEFSHHGRGTTVTYAAVREAAEIHPNKHLKVTKINAQKSD